MFAHIPPKLRHWLVLVSVPCGFVVAAYFVLPLFGLADYVSGKNWFIFTNIAATIPPIVFYVAHLPVHRDRTVNKRVESLFNLGLLGWLGGFFGFTTGHYIVGAVLLPISILLILRAHLKWIAALPSAHEVIVEEGQKILDRESDPAEKEKFAAALERLKKV